MCVLYIYLYFKYLFALYIYLYFYTFYFQVSNAKSQTSAVISFNIETLNSGANIPLYYVVLTRSKI